MKFSPTILVAVLLLITVPSAAQEDLPGVFSEVIEVRVVNVEVVVTDETGARVPGLTAKDFRLKVDGKEVPIDYFTEVRGGDAIEISTEEPGEAPKSLPSVDPGTPVGTSYLLFIDEFFAIPRDRNRVLRRLRDELAHFGPNDRMAMVAFNGKQLEMLSNWTSSPQELARALVKATERPSFGLQRMAERREFDREDDLFFYRPFDQREFSEGLSGALLNPLQRNYAQTLAGQLHRVVLAAAATLRSFASPPGRKVMLLLAGGWPFVPAGAVIRDRANPVLETGIRGGVDLYRPLTDTANLLGYTLYPVDLPGIEGSLMPDAADSLSADLNISYERAQATVGASQALGEVETAEFDNQPTLRVNAALENESHQSLFFLASETGGRALINAERDRVLEQVVADTRSYYWLGFSPKSPADDRRHKIQVEVLRPGLRVRFREGYLHSSREREVTMMVESASLFGNPASHQPLAVKVGEGRRAGFRGMEVPLTIFIPMGAITMLPSGEQYTAKVELRIAAVDSDGKRSDIPVIPIRLAGKEAPRPGSYARYDTTLRVRRARQELVIAIYDPPSGALLSTRVELVP